MRMSEWIELRDRLRCMGDVSDYAKTDNTYSFETLSSVYQQLLARQMMKSFYLVKECGLQFVERYDAGHSLMEIAEWISLSPTMVARRVLELKGGITRKTITGLLRNPAQIKDKRLRNEVQVCVDCDAYSGPHIDRVRNVIGLEYELRLIEELRNLRLEFELEADLRKRGCHKTPDVLLQVPVAFSKKVVRWIDSKAKFGDEFTMNKDYTDAVSSYVGRFGPGMVVYWFGFIEDCPSPMIADAGVVVADTVPKDIQVLPGTFIPISSAGEEGFVIE